MSKWVAFFSQTGSEIYNISCILNKEPDLIITNRTNLRFINENFLIKFKDKIEFIPNRPSEEDYEKLLKKLGKDIIITLHGYLRIVPENICNNYNIYNLHPGLITKYPELKGFNPQEKAYNMKLKTSGAVIHKVIGEVDSGEILDTVEVNIENKSLDDIYNILHEKSTKLWCKFLKKLI